MNLSVSQLTGQTGTTGRFTTFKPEVLSSVGSFPEALRLANFNGRTHRGRLGYIKSGQLSNPDSLVNDDLYLSWNPGNDDPPPPGAPYRRGEPMEMTIYGTNAYIANSGLGVQAVDLTQMAGNKAGAIGGTYSGNGTTAENLYTSISRASEKILAVRSDELVILGTDLRPLGGFAGLNHAYGVTGVEKFPIDIDGDGNLGDYEDWDGDATTSAQESFDLALVSTSDGVVVIDVTEPGAANKLDLIGNARGRVKADREKRVGYANGGAVIFSLRHLRAGLDVSALDTAEDRVLYRSSEPGGAFDISEDGSLLYAANGSTGVMRVVKVGEMVELSLTPDYTRDGVVDGSDKGSVTWDKPWRFWVNDDDDGAADAATGLDGEDLPGSNKDNSDAVVNGIRDLVDLFPLRIDLAEALKAWPPGEGFRYRLKQADSAVTVFEGMAGDLVLTTETAGSYLTDLDVASAFRSARGKVVGPNGVELSPEFLALTSANAASGIVLVEGRARSAQPLVLEISDSNGRFVRSASMAMELAGVEEMYGRKDLRSVAGGTNDAGDRQDMEKLPYNMADSGKSLVWVHGYRVSPENAKATFAEVFKRFYQSGLKGRFYGVSWYGDPLSLSLGEADLGVNYHQSVVNAFATADAFAAFVKTLGDDVSVAAHSLGNLVAGEALQNGLAVKNYFAVDAAVALEAYGETPDFEADGKFNSGGKHASMVKVKDWPDYIDAGQSRLLASEWHKLFGEGDGRSGLTWRGRLGGVPSGNVYNFYSSTEDVLRAYDGDNLVVDEAGSAWGMYSWVKQEKFKGRLDEVVNIAGAASPYCGWSLNPYWTIIGEGGAIRTLSPSEARDRISDTDLKTHPFFRLHQTGLFSGPDINELVADDNGATASAFLSKPVSATSLTNYYEKNKAAHGKVTVRDWLLAEAFPATTLAAGGNRSEQMAQKENNIDMSTDIKANGFMTNAARWPRRETIENMGRDWRHSDYKDIAYQHVFTFYKKIDELIGH